jgi:hypothetical protein
LALEFYPPGSAQGLADCLVRLLGDSRRQQAMATQNFSAALRMTMPNVVQKYLRHFELQQRVQTLRYVSRFRRLPRWIPSKSLLLRLMTRNSLGWARRSAVLHAAWNPGVDAPASPHNGNGRRSLNGSGEANNGNRRAVARVRDGDGEIVSARSVLPAPGGYTDGSEYRQDLSSRKSASREQSERPGNRTAS